MQTNFSLAQLADPNIQTANEILRSCVHCGFCLATCPTYVLLGDELDSPRGRIYLIKNMLEEGGPAPAGVARHLDRCLSCLSCMTTCPSGVDYMHLVDHARHHVEATYRRPAPERLLRAMLARVLPSARLFRLALGAASFARPFRRLLPAALRRMVEMAPGRLEAPSEVDSPQVFPAAGETRMRVALLNGCAQQVLAPRINEATVRLLTRLGCEVVVARGAGCCGALSHHMGKSAPARAAARANIEAWGAEREADGLDGIVINASGCGTTVKDYGFMFRDDPKFADRAAWVAAHALDVSELVDRLGLPAGGAAPALSVAYHSACSLQHGQKLAALPEALLAAAGFEVRGVAESHLCCGSAGTYNLLQPELADRLLERKIANIEAAGAEVIATGNIGCMMQIGGATDSPVVHTVELLDWASGGPMPEPLRAGDGDLS